MNGRVENEFLTLGQHLECNGVASKEPNHNLISKIKLSNLMHSPVKLFHDGDSLPKVFFGRLLFIFA